MVSGDIKQKGALDTAISLFRASRESKTPPGSGVLAVLENAFKNRKITFEPIDSDNNGEYDKGKFTLNSLLVDDPARLSVWLVHEGYHAAVASTNQPYIDEEINSRILQGRFWKSLIEGIPLDGQTYRLPASGQLWESYQNNTIVDWVLGIEKYTKLDDFLTQSWIANHLDDWGGLRTRTFFTKRRYVSVLAQRPHRAVDIAPVARALFKIFKSSSPSEARQQITEAGKGSFAWGQKMVKERFAAIWGGDPAINSLFDEILQWQAQTKIDLGVVPRR